MHRRRLLAALGAGVSLAGCVGVGSDSPGTPTPDGTTTPTETTQTPAGTTATVHDVRVRRIVFTRGVHTDPHFRPGEQFVVADVEASNRELLDRFALVVDGDYLDTGANEGLISPFDDPEGELLGFRVPAPLDAARAAVVQTDGDSAATSQTETNEILARWPLDTDLLRRLAHPPEFEVRGFEIPDEVARGSAFTATLTVANVGSSDGHFRAELGATTISDAPEIEVTVAGDETRTVEKTVEPHYLDDDELTIRLNWGADQLARTAAIED